MNDQDEGLYFDSYRLPPVFKEFSTFLKVMFAVHPISCSTAKTFLSGLWILLSAFHSFAGCSIESTVHRMEKYSDDPIENFVEQILIKYYRLTNK